jgi:hypothetical protein
MAENEIWEIAGYEFVDVLLRLDFHIRRLRVIYHDLSSNCQLITMYLWAFPLYPTRRERQFTCLCPLFNCPNRHSCSLAYRPVDTDEYWQPLRDEPRLLFRRQSPIHWQHSTFSCCQPRVTSLGPGLALAKGEVCILLVRRDSRFELSTDTVVQWLDRIIRTPVQRRLDPNGSKDSDGMNRTKPESTGGSIWSRCQLLSKGCRSTPPIRLALEFSLVEGM